jgi:A/G-specific adenine glycosylase
LKREAFQEIIWDNYAKHGRHDLPWRQMDKDGSLDAYHILVSEMMLQQTQVARVIEKYQAFLRSFPDVASLAAAPLSEVLALWSGLGYNRRAKFLHAAAKQIQDEYNGHVPQTIEALVALPGIGPNTAAAIVAYAFNQPVTFIETNIRTVYIHHFFADSEEVTDKQIMARLEETVDREQPREFYWALMDYGTYVKATVGNTNRRSRHYTKQSAFAGSRRQVRGWIIAELLKGPQTLRDLALLNPDTRLESVLQSLASEGFIEQKKHHYKLVEN